jgi:hypothetical protein
VIAIPTSRKLALAPAARRSAPINFERSVVNGVQISGLPSGARVAAAPHASGGVVRMWGSLANKRAEWDRIRAGDWLLFYTDRRFAAVARVVSKRRDPTLADAVWAPQPGSWENVLFLRDVRPIDVPVSTVAALLGYASDWSGPREFFIPAPAAQQHALSNYADLSSLIVSLTADSSLRAGAEVGESYADAVGRPMSPADVKEIVDRLRARSNGMQPKARRMVVERIERDARVVLELKALYGGRCQVCDDTFVTTAGKNYCEGAHIVPINSRLPGIDSYLNIAILCATCHKKLDHGGMRIFWDAEQAQMLYEWRGQRHPLLNNKHMHTSWTPSP